MLCFHTSRARDDTITVQCLTIAKSQLVLTATLSGYPVVSHATFGDTVCPCLFILFDTVSVTVCLVDAVSMYVYVYVTQCPCLFMLVDTVSVSVYVS